MGFEDHKRKWVFSFVFILLLWVAFLMFKPYLSAIVFGALIAYLAYPLFRKIRLRIKSKFTAQLLVSVGSALLLLSLVSLIAFPLAIQAESLYYRSGPLITAFIADFQACSQETADTSTCKLAQTLSPIINSPEFEQRSKEIIQKTSLFFYEKVSGLLSGVVSFLIFLVIMIFSMFYFLGNGEEIKETIVGILPLSSYDKKRVVQRMQESIRAVVGGNIVAALLQGTAASLIFFILGVAVPIFWGLVIAVLAFIPGVGPAIVWVPITILFFIKGSTAKALILLVYSIVVLSSIENILKPKLIGDKIKMSTYAVFMGVLGGLHFFGILGFFFGPILLALLVTCVQIYREMDGSIEK